MRAQEFGLVARHEHDLRAEPSDLSGHEQSEPTRPSGDQHDAIPKVDSPLPAYLASQQRGADDESTDRECGLCARHP